MEQFLISFLAIFTIKTVRTTYFLPVPLCHTAMIDHKEVNLQFVSTRPETKKEYVIPSSEQAHLLIW